MIEAVSISMFSHTQDYMSVYGQRWVITFTSQKGNLPFLLVDTGSGQPSTIATGGTLLGSSSVVRVRSISDGGLLTRFITPSTLYPILLLPPQQLKRHGSLSHTGLKSGTTRGSGSFGILSPIRNYISDCGGVLVYT